MKAKLFWVVPPEIDPIPVMAVELRDDWKDRIEFLREAGYPQGKDDKPRYVAITLLFNEGYNISAFVWGKAVMSWLPEGFGDMRDGDVLTVGARDEHPRLRRRDNWPGS